MIYVRHLFTSTAFAYFYSIYLKFASFRLEEVVRERKVQIYIDRIRDGKKSFFYDPGMIEKIFIHKLDRTEYFVKIFCKTTTNLYSTKCLSNSHIAKCCSKFIWDTLSLSLSFVLLLFIYLLFYPYHNFLLVINVFFVFLEYTSATTSGKGSLSFKFKKRHENKVHWNLGAYRTRVHRQTARTRALRTFDLLLVF